MTIYNFDDKLLDFDFYSTEPPVFQIIVRPREGYIGAFAEASFRERHDDDHLWSVTAWGKTEDDALKALLSELRQRYTAPKPNRVMVKATGSLVKAIQMEREIAGHLLVDNPHPQIMAEWQEAMGYTDSLFHEQKPNRAVIEIEYGAVAGVRAERPGEIIAIVYDKDDDDGEPFEVAVEQLNCVEEL